MDKERLKMLAGNPRHIPGIYNYCDRWCERCTFTSRCLTYAMEQEDPLKDDPEANDIRNKKFWDRIGENFRMTMEMIREDAEKLGIDLDNLPDDPEYAMKEKEREEAVENHPLTKKAKKYMFAVKKWFEGSERSFKLKADELLQKMVIELKDEDPEKDLELLQDAVDVVKWYFMQIGVKLSRAFSGRISDEQDGWNLDGEFPRDSDGSAKVSLIGIDRSIAAWGTLLQQMPNEEDHVLPLLVLLEKLRTGIEKEFPEARTFKRPGFDD